MKKTFKGYSALIALLIALLVVTSMPLLAFAADDDDVTVVKWTDADGVVQSHEVLTSSKTTVREATCQQEGIDRYECTDPSHGKTTNIRFFHEVFTEKADHTPVTVIENGGSCTTGGTAVTKCSVCGEVLSTRTLAATGHTFDQAALEDAGFVFGKDGTKTTVTLPEDEDFDAADYADLIVIDSYPTCRADGKAHLVCTVCGAAGSTIYIPKGASSHDWDGWVVEKAGTCNSAGIRVRWCKICGTKEEGVDPQKDPKLVVLSTELVDCYTRVEKVYCEYCENGAGGGHGTKADPKSRTITSEVGSHEFNDKVVVEDECDNVNIDSKGNVTLINCELEGKVVYQCDHFDDNPLHEDDDTSYQTVKIAATGHDWNAWTLRYSIGAGDNEYAYYIRTCKNCEKVEELVTKGDPNAADAIKPVDDRTFTIDLTDVEDGAGTAVATVSDMEGAKIYARVTWVYELSDGSTFAYAAMADVEEDTDNNELTIEVAGASTPRGATLVETQVALTDDAKANTKGEFNQLAGAKK